MLLVEKYHYSFIETSALDSSNVGEAFNNLLVGKCIKEEKEGKIPNIIS